MLPAKENIYIYMYFLHTFFYRRQSVKSLKTKFPRHFFEKVFPLGIREFYGLQDDQKLKLKN